MTRYQFLDITRWQRETFGQATLLSKLAHLDEEVVELRDSIQAGSSDARLEFADCFLLLFGCASAYGMTYDDVVTAIDEKMKINKTRKWGNADVNGVVKHIE